MNTWSIWIHRCLGVAMVLVVAACAAEVPTKADYTVSVGQELDITLGTVGPGPAYDTIPKIASPAVRFLDVSEPADLRNPGGPVQLFQFEAQARGRTTITFRRSATEQKTVRRFTLTGVDTVYFGPQRDTLLSYSSVATVQITGIVAGNAMTFDLTSPGDTEPAEHFVARADQPADYQFVCRVQRG